MERRGPDALEIEPIAETPPPSEQELPEPEEATAQEVRDEEEAEGAEPYFAPVDPVIDDGGRDVVGGLEGTSMDSIEVDPSTIDAEPGDEALADAVRRELAEDALTRDLDLDVQIRGAVAFLRGAVEYLEDTDNAAEVASRVPGVRTVVEQIAIRGS